MSRFLSVSFYFSFLKYWQICPTSKPRPTGSPAALVLPSFVEVEAQAVNGGLQSLDLPSVGVAAQAVGGGLQLHELPVVGIKAQAVGGRLQAAGPAGRELKCQEDAGRNWTRNKGD